MAGTIGKDVYTTKGKYVGRVTDISVDIDAKSVSALEMKIARGKGASGTEIVLVPYDLVVAVDDIVLIGMKR
ncbi:MAG: PRC-barrel domain-containing protein [Promethearchaeati archaeon SRVP18_Atabeyarchaeia-1]